MGDRQGYLVYADSHQVQRSLETKGLSGFLNEMSVSRQEELLNAMTGAFQAGSSKKSYFFMDFKYRDYAALQRGFSYRMPVYGVKGGIAGLTRATNYVQAMVAKEKELSGQNFNSTVFGADFLRSEEVTVFSAGMLTEALNRSGKGISNKISADSRKKICCLTERVWHFQEINPRTRLVILLQNAEARSAEILRQIYLLFPQQLRMQLGFETNIAREDLDAINNAGGLPIYILTMEKDEYRDLSGYDFPVETVDFETLDEGKCDAGRLNLLMSLAKNMSELNAGLFDHAEKKVIEGKEGNASSFKYYGEIVERMTSGDLFWWTSRNIGSIEQLKEMYDDQTYLMTVPELKEEAIRTFYTEIYPNTNLSRQVVQIATDKSYKNRQSLLDFLSDELFLKPQIQGAQQLKESLEKEKTIEIEDLKATSKRQILAEREKVTREYEKQLAAVDEMAATNADKAEKLKKNLDITQNDLREAKEELERLKNRVPDSEDSDERRHTHSKSDKQLKKKAQNFLTAAIVLGVLFAVAAVFAVINMMNAENLRTQLAAVNAAVTKVQAQLDEATKENSELKTQLEELIAEKEKQAGQIENAAADTGEESATDLVTPEAQTEADRLAEEEAARLEAERIAAEEAARLEAERIAAEEAAQLEAERIAAENASQAEAENQAGEQGGTW